MVRNALSARGHIVGAVDDGKRVVDIAIARQPDLVILDCSMPEVSGIEALRQMRLSPLCPQMPVLILTARRSQVDEDIAMRAGASDYLRKPFDVDALVSRVELLLERAERRTRYDATVSSLCLPQARRSRRWGQR